MNIGVCQSIALALKFALLNPFVVVFTLSFDFLDSHIFLFTATVLTCIRKESRIEDDYGRFLTDFVILSTTIHEAL
jgi:hypothetical protein